MIHTIACRRTRATANNDRARADEAPGGDSRAPPLAPALEWARAQEAPEHGMIADRTAVADDRPALHDHVGAEVHPLTRRHACFDTEAVPPRSCRRGSLAAVHSRKTVEPSRGRS